MFKRVLKRQTSDSTVKLGAKDNNVAPKKPRPRILSDGGTTEYQHIVTNGNNLRNGLIIKRDVDHPSNGYRGLAVVNGNDHQRGLVHPQLPKQRLDQPTAMKKSEAGRLPVLKPGSGVKKAPVSKSPSLPKKSAPEGSTMTTTTTKPRSGSNTLQLPEEATQYLSRSLEDLDAVESGRENGSGSSDILDDTDGHVMEGSATDTTRTRAAIEHIQEKIMKTMEQIKDEQSTKEANVNEYLKLAGEADKLQLQRIKQVFEKKNQKSTANLSHLQKKLENYNKKLKDIETYGVTGHKQAKEVLKDMGQGLKGVGANIVDGITGFSGGVVGNIKGAKETIVSKPREFAHLIKNKFGSVDNVNTFKSPEEAPSDDPAREGHQGGGTLPASFKYGSEEENSSITSGSGIGHSSPQSSSHNASQQVLISQVALDTVMQELNEAKESGERLKELLQRTMEEFEQFKVASQQELMLLKTSIEEDKFKMERIEDQMNDITELNQNEVTNLKQDIGSMEEKIEYRLEERTSDIQDLLENCQTRVTKMELQQQQQQLISMEMVENVTFRTILTKLINVVLAILAVILVFVSTTANLLAPFLTTRARILSTSVLIFCVVISWQNWHHICVIFWQTLEYIQYLLPNR